MSDPTTLADTATTAMGGISAFNSWVMTPTGATLTLLLIGFGIAAAVRKGVRWVQVTLRVVIVLWVVWILGGILEAWGVPVRESISAVGGQIPNLMLIIVQWFARLFQMSA